MHDVSDREGCVVGSALRSIGCTGEIVGLDISERSLSNACAKTYTTPGRAAASESAK
jgi:hypothetical protein